jgi:hypothetical protein
MASTSASIAFPAYSCRHRADVLSAQGSLRHFRPRLATRSRLAQRLPSALPSPLSSISSRLPLAIEGPSKLETGVFRLRTAEVLHRRPEVSLFELHIRWGPCATTPITLHSSTSKTSGALSRHFWPLPHRAHRQTAEQCCARLHALLLQHCPRCGPNYPARIWPIAFDCRPPAPGADATWSRQEHIPSRPPTRTMSYIRARGVER